jgi:hypothetical protein
MSETFLGASQLNTSWILLESTDIPPLQNNMAQEKDLSQPELALAKLCVQLVLSKFLQNQMKL